MSIRVYQKNGQQLFKVSANVWNPTRAYKVQRVRSGIATRPKAVEIEKTLFRSATEEMLERESKGLFWGQLVDQWELHLRKGFNQGRSVSKMTAQDLVAALRMYTSRWDRISAAKIGKNHIRQVFNLMDEEGKSNGRKRAINNAINSCYEWGLENDHIKGVFQSPTYGVKIKITEDKKPEILNLNEIRLLLKAAQDMEHEWYHVWAMALLTGMRHGELFALEWKDIDWTTRQITVSKSYSCRLKTIKSTKAGDWRDVPISSQLETLLKEIRANSTDPQFVLPRVSGWKRGDAAKILRTFCRGVGLKPIKFHTLRSCFATQLIGDSVAPAVVMRICGWKGLKTMQHYVRLAGIEVDGATEGLKLLTPRETMENVVQLYGPRKPS